MHHRSIRFRLAIWYSLALAAGLILLALATWFSMRHMLLRDVRLRLDGEMENSAAFVEAELHEPHVQLAEELGEYASAFISGSYLRVVDETGRVSFNSHIGFPWLLAKAYSEGTAEVDWAGKRYLVLIRERRIGGRSWRFEISSSLDETQILLSRLGLLLLMLIPMVIAFAAAGGIWLSRKALAPVDEMTAAARSVSVENLSARLAVPQTGDELQRLADTWNSMLARLEDSLRRLSAFTADASHELRTPLAVIRATAELMSRRERPAEVYRGALKEIAAESERMTKLLEDLLLLARMDSEVVEMPQSNFELAELVSALCSQIKPLADAKNVHVRFDRGNPDTKILGNPDGVQRLILALLDNAVKYSPEGAEIALTLNYSTGQICLDVTDRGPGIAQGELTRIFERFYRSAEAREGTGLGLSLAAGLAKKNHAQISVLSEPGKGSTFRVAFQAGA